MLVCKVFYVYLETWCPEGLVLCKLQDLGPSYDYDANSLRQQPEMQLNSY